MEGHVAADGDAENSPYTQAFLKNVVDPRLEIDTLFRRVHDDVMVATQNRQEPHTYGSLTGESFHFATKWPQIRKSDVGSETRAYSTRGAKLTCKRHRTCLLLVIKTGA